jgi:hypothetical protein
MAPIVFCKLNSADTSTLDTTHDAGFTHISTAVLGDLNIISVDTTLLHPGVTVRIMRRDCNVKSSSWYAIDKAEKHQ